MMRFISFLLSFLFVGGTAYSNESCRVTISYTASIVPGSWFYDNQCGKPDVQKWSYGCLRSFERGALWRNSSSFDGSRDQRIIGYMSYFLVTYNQKACSAHYIVPNEDALLFGSYREGALTKKLYAVLADGDVYNTLVQLTRGVRLQRDGLIYLD